MPLTKTVKLTVRVNEALVITLPSRSLSVEKSLMFDAVQILIYLFLSRTSLWSCCIPSGNRPVDLVLYQCRHGNNLSYVNWLESVCGRSPLPWPWQSLLVLVGTQQYHRECFGHTNTEILPENFECIIIISVQQTGFCFTEGLNMF